MPGTTVTLRPDETYNAGDWWTVAGGPTTVHAALADNSDLTYATTTGNPAWVGMTNLDTIPNGARIVSVTVRVRWSGDNTTYGAVGLTDNLLGKSKPLTAFYKVPNSTRTDSFQALATRPDGSAWTVDAVNSISVQVQASGVGVRFYEVYADVVYNAAPTVSSVTPTGSLTVQQPTIGWAYTDPDGDAQERWQVKVFTGAQAGAAGFNAATSVGVADSGTAYYSAPSTTSWIVPTALSPGVYRVFVRAADAGSNGRYSTWAEATFTVVGDPPAPPAMLSVIANPDMGRTEITVRQTDNLLNQMTATGSGAVAEFLRWFVYGNVTTPVSAAGGLEGNGISCVVVANGEVAVAGLRFLRVIPELVTVWAGWIKSSQATGIMHLDIAWFDAERTYIRMDEGGYVGLTTTMQASEGRTVAPENAAYAYLMWRSSGALAANQSLTWDDTGIWFTRTDADLGDLEAQLIKLEDDVVDLEIRVADLEGVPPTISITPSQAPIDATAYRGGLDSRNLLGPGDASFQYPLTDTNWRIYTAPGNTGTTSIPLDPAGYDGYTLQIGPGTVGATHWLLSRSTYPLPLVDAEYQFSFRHRATSVGSSPATTLRAYGAIVFTSSNGTVVGAPVSTGTFTLARSDDLSDPVYINARPPAGATRFYLEVNCQGETSVDDRWVFDQFQVVRVPAVPPDHGFGFGPFGYGPFGGDGEAAAFIPWKPASQVDVYPYVEYSTDGGASWQPVRRTEYAAYDPYTRVARIYDYETPLGVETMYRARTAARDYQTDPVSGTLLISSATTSRAVTLTVTDHHLVDPFTQTRIPFRIAASGGAPELKMTRPTPQQDFSPVGRRYKIILSDVAKGNEFSWRIVTPTAADWDAMEAMLATGHTLLVQTPIGRSWYIKPGATRQLTAALEGATDHGAVIEFSGYEQARP